QRAAEELHLLRDEPDARTQALEVDVARVDAADPHAPGAGVVEAEDEARERRLARASAAQEAQPAAGREVERHAVQRELVGAGVEVVEVDAVERDRQRAGRQLGRAAGRQRRARAEQLADALHAGGGLLELLELL